MERKLNREEIANEAQLPLLDSLECSIDMMISLNPYICKKCENVFCQECLSSWKKKSEDCPMRCSPFEYTSLENTVLKTQIKKIRLFCGNKIYGCKETPLVFEKDNHEKNCAYQPINCPKCKIFVSKFDINEHYLKSCEKMKIKCLLCEINFSLLDFFNHIKLCLNNFSNCENCFKKINSNQINFQEEHYKNCSMKVSYCKICKIPEFEQVLSTDHKHNEISDVEKISIKSILQSNFYKLMKQLEDQYNINLNTIDYNKKMIINYASDVYEFISENQNSVLKKLEENILHLESKKNERILKLKFDKINENKELVKEINEIKYLILKSDEEISNLNWIIIQNNDSIKNQGDNIIYRKINDINNLLEIYNQLINLKNTASSSVNNYDNSNFNHDTEKNNGTIIINNTSSNFKIDENTENSKTKINSEISSSNNMGIKNNLINENKPNPLGRIKTLLICENCGRNTKINSCHSCNNKVCENCLLYCKNKNADHQKNIYCNDCVKTCTLCAINIQCVPCMKKCFYKECKNFYCSTCYDKNKHQMRPETTNCRFYKCDSCNTDGSCIMSTIYCSMCDRRVCKNCLQKDHITHINFK